MLEIILDKFFGPKNYLPRFHINSKLDLELTKLNLEFFIKMFLKAATKAPPLTGEEQLWFLEQIASCQMTLNPKLDYQERVSMLQKVVMEFNQLRIKK